MADEKPLDVKITLPAIMRDVDVMQLLREPVKVPAITGSVSTISAIQTCIEQIKKVIETREGTNGSWVEKSVTWRDLIGSGLARITVDGNIYNPGGGGGGGGGGGVLPPLNPPETPVYTPPPAPTGVQANGAMTNIIVEWNAPGYSYHGHAEVWRAESDNLGVAVLIGTSTSTLFVDEVGNATNRYYWVRFVSKWGVTGPYNDTDGTLATTGIDVPYILGQLEGQITQTHLDAALSAEIDQIDVLAIEVSALSAGVSGAFDPFYTYYFDTTAEGWVADSSATVSHSSGHLIVDSTGTTPSVKLNVDLSGFAGANYPVVKVRTKRANGSTWSGKLQWKTAGHGFSGGYQKIISDPTLAVGDYATIEWDLSADADYTASQIMNLRIELGAASDDDFDIDWIAVGRNAPGASVAMVGAETTARVNADNAEITERRLLSTKVLGTNDPNAITGLNDLTAGMIYEEKSVRSSQDAALASSVSTLSTTVGNNTAAIQVATQSISGLSAQYTVKIDSNGYVSGFGLASEPREGDPGGQISTFGIRADTFYIASPSGPGITPTMPFIVKTTNWTSAGNVSNPPGVYMQDAYIANGQIVNAKIGQLAVDDAKIANLNAAKITAGTIAADRLDANVITSKVISVDVAKLTTGIVGGNIYSQAYASGSAGWALYQNGYADLNNVQVRGQINGGAYTGYAWPPAGNYGFHLGPQGLLLGNANNNKYFQVTYDGNVSAPGLTITNGSATFSGTLSAASGSFSGNISGSTGTFYGALGASTGTFAGLVTGSAVVDTLQLAGNAVIIPAASQQYDMVYGIGDWQTILTCNISLSEYTTLFMFANVNLLFTNWQDSGNYPSSWAVRILGHSGENIVTMGPAVSSSGFVPQSIVPLQAKWAENAGTRTFYLQFWGQSNYVQVFGRSIAIIGTRKSF